MGPVDTWPATLLLPASAGRESHAVWGCLPASRDTSLREALDHTLRREVTLWRLRRGAHGPVRLAGVHRVTPTTTCSGRAKAWIGRALRGGALVEIGPPGETSRLLDLIVRAAGGTAAVSSLRLGSGGTALVTVSRGDGSRELLRMAPAGSPADPSPTAAQRAALACIRHDLVPRLLGYGEVSGIAWTAESLMPGARPRHVSPSLARQVVAFCATLPLARGAPTAPAEDLVTLAALLRDREPSLRRVASEVARGITDVPAAMRHGDLWTGNLLVEKGELRGVVDWDAVHARALPGTDLLQLVATDRRRRKGLALGEVWLQRPWRWPCYVEVTEPYWARAGLRLTDELGELLAVSWWAGEVAGTLRRLPHRATDERWLAANVDPVLTTLTPT